MLSNINENLINNFRNWFMWHYNKQIEIRFQSELFVRSEARFEAFFSEIGYSFKIWKIGRENWDVYSLKFLKNNVLGQVFVLKYVLICEKLSHSWHVRYTLLFLRMDWALPLNTYTEKIFPRLTQTIKKIPSHNHLLKKIFAFWNNQQREWHKTLIVIP